MSEHPSPPPSTTPAKRGWKQRVRLALAVGGVVVLALGLALTTMPGSGSAPRAQPVGIAAQPPVAPPPVPVPATAPPPLWEDPGGPQGAGALAPGSDPAVLPGDLLIADRDNNRLVVVDPYGRVRWTFPRQGDLAPGETFQVPDDAFFSPDGTRIIATEEDVDTISVVDIASHRIVYRYGVPGHPGAGPNHLANPDDAMLLPDGYILTADIKNCRILLIAPGEHSPRTAYGDSTHGCAHQPPARFGSPNGAFPMRDGNWLITEINGDWVDEMSLTGAIAWSTHPPAVHYPSDTNEIGPDRYLTVDYSKPGQAVVFDHTGRTIWRYRPTGADALDHPSLALPLPNGDIALNDDANHRVIVVDPRTNRIVWQYGHTGHRGAGDGYLNNPDGIDLAPPESLLVSHATTMSGPG